ncbi:hypothetical protein U1Q18_005054 [Sarracenia purpurea var. burkii]
MHTSREKEKVSKFQGPVVLFVHGFLKIWTPDTTRSSPLPWLCRFRWQCTTMIGSEGGSAMWLSKKPNNGFSGCVDSVRERVRCEKRRDVGSLVGLKKRIRGG